MELRATLQLYALERRSRLAVACQAAVFFSVREGDARVAGQHLHVRQALVARRAALSLCLKYNSKV